MTCSRRIYKGEDTEILVPFNVEGYSSLTISFYTDGEHKYTIDNPDVVDGNIVAAFGGHDFDILGDGVIRYNISYEIDGEEQIISTNTPFVLKTPAAYSAMTPTDYYHEGEVVGRAEGYVSGYTEGHEIGYVEGHAQGKQDGEAVGYDMAVSDIRNQSISLSVSANGTYSANTQDSIYFNEVNVNVPQGSGGTSDFTWAGKSCAFEGSGWMHGEDPDDEYDYQPFFTLPHLGYFDQLSLDVFIISTFGRPYIMSTQDLDGTGHYLNIRANDSGFTIEYKDNGNPREHEVHIPCEMYSNANYHIDITFEGVRDSMKIIVVGPDGRSAVSATTSITQLNPTRQMCINGVYDSDFKIYDYVYGGFMFRNMRIYGTGALMHNYQWYDGHIVDTISGNAYYGWHYYWDEDEEQWDTEIKYMNGYNDAYMTNN